MFKQFTDRARNVMQAAEEEARSCNHEYVGTEHVLLGLLNEIDGIAAAMLYDATGDIRRVEREVKRVMLPGPEESLIDTLPQTPRVKKAINDALNEARALNHVFVEPEHLLLGLLRDDEGFVYSVFLGLSIDPLAFRTELQAALRTTH